MASPTFRLLCLAGLLGWCLAPVQAHAQAFTFEVADQTLPASSFGTLGWGDVDQDGVYDVLVDGNVAFPTLPKLNTGLYRWQATSEGAQQRKVTYTEASSLPAADVRWLGAVAWSDFDGDGHLDVFHTGATAAEAPYTPTAAFYRNAGDGAFTRAATLPFGYYSASAAWADFDGDGDADLLVAGAVDQATHRTDLYRNDGGTLQRVDAGLPGLAFGDLAVGDYDNDGDPDVAITGATADGDLMTRLYRNDGGTFVDVEAALPGLAFGDLDWGDYDGDGDLDLALNGGRWGLRTLEGETHLYRNVGGLLLPAARLDGTIYGTVAWGDYDNDGDLDLLVSGGRSALEGRTGRVYRNEDGTLEHVLYLAPLFPSIAVWGDYDGDGDLDVLLSGTDDLGEPRMVQYVNTSVRVNNAPTVPEGLQAGNVDGHVTLRWDAATDAETASPSLTYNLRVGTAPGASDVVAPLAGADGRRYVSRRGNVDHSTRRILQGLPDGTYYWSVQALDAAFQGSPFAEERSFTVRDGQAGVATDFETPADLPTRLALGAAYPNPFQGAVTVPFDVPAPQAVAIHVYDVLGRRVATLADGVQPAGRLEVTWDGASAQGRALPAGVYFVRLTAGEAQHTLPLTRL